MRSKEEISPLGPIWQILALKSVVSVNKNTTSYITNSPARVFKSCRHWSLTLLPSARAAVELPLVQVPLDLPTFLDLTFCQEENYQLWPFFYISPLHFTQNDLHWSPREGSSSISSYAYQYRSATWEPQLWFHLTMASLEATIKIQSEYFLAELLLA